MPPANVVALNSRCASGEQAAGRRWDCSVFLYKWPDRCNFALCFYDDVPKITVYYYNACELFNAFLRCDHLGNAPGRTAVARIMSTLGGGGGMVQQQFLYKYRYCNFVWTAAFSKVGLVWSAHDLLGPVGEHGFLLDYDMMWFLLYMHANWCSTTNFANNINKS